MNSLRIVQLGFGGVGQALVRQYLSLSDRYPWLGYTALSDRSGMCWLDDGWTTGDLRGALEAKEQGQALSDFARGLGERARLIPPSGSRLPRFDFLLDCTNPAGRQDA